MAARGGSNKVPILNLQDGSQNGTTFDRNSEKES